MIKLELQGDTPAELRDKAIEFAASTGPRELIRDAAMRSGGAYGATHELLRVVRDLIGDVKELRITYGPTGSVAFQVVDSWPA